MNFTDARAEQRRNVLSQKFRQSLYFTASNIFNSNSNFAVSISSTRTKIKDNNDNKRKIKDIFTLHVYKVKNCVPFD